VDLSKLKDFLTEILKSNLTKNQKFDLTCDIIAVIFGTAYFSFFKDNNLSCFVLALLILGFSYWSHWSTIVKNKPRK